MRAALVWLLLGIGCGGARAEPEAAPVAAQTEPVTVVLALRFVEAPDLPDGETPRTRVLLVDIDEARGRRTTELGAYDGVCSHVRPREGHLIAARCFWAGTGAQIDVRREGDSIVVTEDVLDADGGLVDRHDNTRIDLPAEADVEVMAPRTRLGD